MGKIVIIGGGWAGCAAAIRARKQGHEVQLLEKTDLLLGLGNVGGIMRNNGRYTAAEENIALGADELFEITDRLSTHRNIDFPGHRHRTAIVGVAEVNFIIGVEVIGQIQHRGTGVFLPVLTRLRHTGLVVV